MSSADRIHAALQWIAEKACSLGLVALSVIWCGWVLARLWLWFVVPALGAPALSLPHAVGLDLLVTLIAVPSPRPTGCAPVPVDAKAHWLLKGMFLRPFLALAAGYVVHLWAVSR